MNIIGWGITVAGIGVLWLLVVFKDCLRRGYITYNEAFFSKVSIVLIAVGMMLLAIGWIGVINI